MRILFFVLMLSNAFAQVKWYKGAVVMHDDRVIGGELMIHTDVLLIKNNERVDVYPAHKVTSIRFYDAEANVNRQFLALTDADQIYTIAHFFEVVARGEYTVVRRKHYPLLNSALAETDYNYYSLYKNKLVALKKFRSQVYPAMLDTLTFELNDFVSKQHLNPNRMDDAIRIIQFYNSRNQEEISIAAL